MSLYSASFRQYLRSSELRHHLLLSLKLAYYIVLMLVVFYVFIITDVIPHVKALVGLADPIEECYENTLFELLAHPSDVCRRNPTLVLAIESVIYALFTLFTAIAVPVEGPTRFLPRHPRIIAKFLLITLLAMASLMLFLYVLVPLYYYLAYPP